MKILATLMILGFSVSSLASDIHEMKEYSGKTESAADCKIFLEANVVQSYLVSLPTGGTTKTYIPTTGAVVQVESTYAVRGVFGKQEVRVDGEYTDLLNALTNKKDSLQSPQKSLYVNFTKGQPTAAFFFQKHYFTKNEFFVCLDLVKK